MRTHLHFDCLSGISGDMTLASLIDLGVDVDHIRRGLDSLNVADLKLVVDDVKKCGFRSKFILVEHPEQKAHRHLHHIDAMIDAAKAITDSAKTLAKAIFLCVGKAEARVHGCDLQKVHFHEVGAVDSIADIVGVAIAIDALGVQSVSSSPVPTGTGSITIDHGRVAVPAPATAEILIGVPIAECAIESELTTPTGAAIIKTLTERFPSARPFGPSPAMVAYRVGYGAGSRDLPGQANVLRITMGELQSGTNHPGQLEADRVTLLETNIDDATGEELADVAERLFAAGALDVWQTPCVMKKGRLACVLAVLCGGSKVTAMQNLLFENTSTIGIRRQVLERTKLVRRSVTVKTDYGTARGKVVTLPNGNERFTIEDDEAKRLATAAKVTTSEIREKALLAWRSE
ncbi:nickel pincer cofactor biosynthesis protein LarC [Neorhodopirellula lusitana]|nr:nickel pincer cofactor biosynthesis protein LarC [Neorhodopirellula lusitana]